MTLDRVGIVTRVILLGLLAAGGGVVSACGGSSPSTPTGPTTTGPVTPAAALAIAGGANLQSPGTSAQLLVTATPVGGTAADVTARATWLSSNPAVATVTAGGLVTTVALGEATITATVDRQTANLAVEVQSGSGPIASCGTFRGPGPFTLTGDIPQTAGLCAYFSGLADTVLDCQGHDIRSINVLSARNFTIRNCRVHGMIPNLVGEALQNFRLQSGTGILVEGIDVLGAATIRNCDDCTIRGSTFVYPQAGFTPGGGFVSGELVVTDGRNVTLTGNTVDGGWDGGTGATYQRQGCDDGILFHRTTGLRIEDNLIVNAFDAGIEPSAGDAPLTVVIRHNTIRRMGFTGIGAYYEWGFRDSVIAGNTVTDTPNLMHLDATGASIADVTAITFENNVIENNVLRSPVPRPPFYGGAMAPAILIRYAPSSLPYAVSNNLVRGNDLGLNSPAPVLEPAAGFIDGGGNSCATGGVLACGGAAAGVTGGRR
ncbi:MAG: right-handed parallel beta-helix repeat-containing protein [Vicinamibacterales bacterium]